MGRRAKHRVAKKSGILGHKQVGDKLQGIHTPHTPGPPPRVAAVSWATDQPSLTCMSSPLGPRSPSATPSPGSLGVNRWPDPSYISGKLPTNAWSTASGEKLSSEGFTLASSTHPMPLLTEQGEKNKSTHTHK